MNIKGTATAYAAPVPYFCKVCGRGVHRGWDVS